MLLDRVEETGEIQKFENEIAERNEEKKREQKRAEKMRTKILEGSNYDETTSEDEKESSSSEEDSDSPEEKPRSFSYDDLSSSSSTSLPFNPVRYLAQVLSKKAREK